MLPKNKNLQSVQVLRGVASLLVVLYHVGGLIKLPLHTVFFFNAFRFGEMGVDIFFVISGFIITYTSFKNIEDIKQLPGFIQKKATRKLPTYWLVITILFTSF